MSLKAIEMQIALPRTHDAGKLQEQIQQRGQLQNDLASHSVHKEEEKKRTSVIKQEETDHVQLSHKEKEKQDSEQKKRQKQKEEIQIKEKERHPYKGNYVDFSG
ncbi:hypothetical protein SM124_17205 [Bacillus sp. 31A1R]|uniref:RNA polymerase subunit sigma n=1 Tax=Robertmurraya mangrovi TaxID=3098077 RepID=A0ABU5J230_9BACI|nr:hypothetical protein [Bacillus sp. 31A1R]MDZ5473454.1 hypothetical protein [Bacillus sp. 31A1R]